MKIEVRCSDCKCAWLIEQSAAAAGVNCPMCEAPVALTPAAAGAAVANTRVANAPVANAPVANAPVANAPVANAPVASAPVAQARAPVAAPSAAVSVAVDAPVAAAAPDTDEEVICPRCKLHFHPFKGAAVVDDSRRPTVLVVEDLEYFREVAADALGQSYLVKTAQTVHEARVAIAEGGIDLILLDLTLDDNEGGRDLLEELDPKPCPILIFTAQDESEMYGESWEQLKQMGADDLVIKGMNVGESLVRKVGEILCMPVDDA